MCTWRPSPACVPGQPADMQRLDFRTQDGAGGAGSGRPSLCRGGGAVWGQQAGHECRGPLAPWRRRSSESHVALGGEWAPGPGRAGQATLQLGSGLSGRAAAFPPTTPLCSPGRSSPVPTAPGRWLHGREPGRGASQRGPGWSLDRHSLLGPGPRPSPCGLSSLMQSPRLGTPGSCTPASLLTPGSLLTGDGGVRHPWRGPSRPCLQHLPLGGPEAWPGTCRACPPPAPAVQDWALWAAELTSEVSQQGQAGGSVGMSRSGHLLRLPLPRPSPYLGRSSWDPGALGRWWTPGAPSPARGTPGTWGRSRVRETESCCRGRRAAGGTSVGPAWGSFPTSWGCEGTMRGLGRPGFL